MEQMTVPMKTTKKIAGIGAALDISVLMGLAFRGQKHVLRQLSAGTELIRLLYVALANAI